ncbi:MAG: hypothetical protein ABJA71_12265, partial [Ginsengibacter sp.]
HSYTTLSSVYTCSGKFEEARKLSQTAIDLDANSFLSYCSLAMSLHGLGRYEEGIEALNFAANISARHQYPLFMLSWFYSAINNKSETEKVLDELIIRSNTEFISGLSLSVAAYYAQNYDKAYEFLERAFAERSSLLISIGGYPFLSFIKTDSRFQPFLQRMNYPEKGVYSVT